MAQQSDDPVYEALGRAGTEAWIVVCRGHISFRFGPFEPAESGAILDQMIQEEIPALLVLNCGKPIDWQLCRDLRGDLSKRNWWQRLVVRVLKWLRARRIAREIAAYDAQRARQK